MVNVSTASEVPKGHEGEISEPLKVWQNPEEIRRRRFLVITSIISI